MNEKITVNYRGYKIDFFQGSNKAEETWKSELGEKWHERNSFHDIKKKIDLFIKKESEFSQVEAIILSFREMKHVLVTSIDRDDKYAWTKDDDGRREKQGIEYLHKYNEKNKNIIKQAHELDKQIVALREEKGSVLETMDKLMPSTDSSAI